MKQVSTQSKAPSSRWTEVPELRDVDVCCGRGKRHLKHPGNKKFQEAVLASLDAYAQASTKTEKSKVVSAIVSSLMASGARFVKKDSKTGKWYDIGEVQAHDKTGHAIRDHILNKSKKHATEMIREARMKAAALGNSNEQPQNNFNGYSTVLGNCFPTVGCPNQQPSLHPQSIVSAGHSFTAPQQQQQDTTIPCIDDDMLQPTPLPQPIPSLSGNMGALCAPPCNPQVAPAVPTLCGTNKFDNGGMWVKSRKLAEYAEYSSLLLPPESFSGEPLLTDSFPSLGTTNGTSHFKEVLDVCDSLLPLTEEEEDPFAGLLQSCEATLAMDDMSPDGNLLPEDWM